MNIITCGISGLLILEPKVFGDQRGFFMETWNLGRYRDCRNSGPLCTGQHLQCHAREHCVACTFKIPTARASCSRFSSAKSLMSQWICAALANFRQVAWAHPFGADSASVLYPFRVRPRLRCPQRDGACSSTSAPISIRRRMRRRSAGTTPGRHRVAHRRAIAVRKDQKGLLLQQLPETKLYP